MPSIASAAGRWTTYIRAFGVSDVETGRDSVWFGTTAAGLLLLDRRTGAIESQTRDFGGLSGNEISALAFDRSHRLWVGTLGGGIGRLANDGRWSLVNAFDGLPSDSVTVVKAYGDTVWVGTPGGFALWNGREITGRLPDGVNPSPFASDRISGIVMIGDSLWIATARGVYLSTLSTGLQNWSLEVSGLFGSDVTGMAAAGRTLFAVSSGLLWRRVGASWSLESGLGTVYRISEDHGVVLASCSTGLQRWDGTSWNLVDAALASNASDPPNSILAAAFDATGKLFAGLEGRLWLTDSLGVTSSVVTPGPVDNNLVNVLSDGAGIYVTTRTRGSARLRDGVWLNWPAVVCDTCTVQPFYVGDGFSAFVDADGRKWFSIWDDAVEVLDDNGPSTLWTHLWRGSGRALDSHTWGWCAAVDAAGGRWIGGDSPCIDCGPNTAPIGIDYYRPGVPLETAYVRTYSRDSTSGMLGNQIRALTVDSRGYMWVGYGTAGGDGGVNSFLIPLNPGDSIDMLGEISGLSTPAAKNVFGVVTYGDSVWVMSEDDLRLYVNNATAQTPKLFDKLGPVAEPGSVHPLEITSDGSVWMAADGGVRVYHPNGTREDFTTANSALASNTVRTIRREVGSNALWFGTTGGLNRYDPDYVAPPAPPLASLHVRVFPNPVTLTNLGFGLRLTGEGTAYRGGVYGIDGRRVRPVVVSGNGAVVWDGRDDKGELVPPGIYFVHVEAGGRSATARVVVLR